MQNQNEANYDKKCRICGNIDKQIKFHLLQTLVNRMKRKRDRRKRKNDKYKLIEEKRENEFAKGGEKCEKLEEKKNITKLQKNSYFLQN